MVRPGFLTTLQGVLSKYRQGVHHLAPGASEDAIKALESHLGRRLPPGLRAFLGEYNGGALFRERLMMRSVAEIAPAHAAARNVLLFADTAQGERWAAAARRHGGWAFGLWSDETGLEPLHSTFDAWMIATLDILQVVRAQPDDQARMRFQVDQNDPYQCLARGQEALADGQPEDAARFLQTATQHDPTLARAWQALGDALAPTDARAARTAWSNALQHTELPFDWPGAPGVHPELFRSLARTAQAAEPWERELTRFLDERVHDVAQHAEFAVLVAANSALASSLMSRGRRREARGVLADLLSRSPLYALGTVPWPAALDLAALEIDLGHHDDAEAVLRRVRREGPPEVQGPALAALARIAINREEPWAEEILAEAMASAKDDAARIQIALLGAERAIRQNRSDDARARVAMAEKLVARGAPRSLRAQLAAVQGDVCKVSEDTDGALAAYRAATDLLGDMPAVELRARIELRRGDLALLGSDPLAAERHYEAAAAAFSQHELPVREAWAMVRLARLLRDRDTLLQAAKVRFLAADLAAGVAVCDALAQDPSASLAWHLERATLHARARHDAQRSRPPWTRADADRPERRLGAHRMAIAACGPTVVDGLGRELDANGRALSTGRGRALDPAVLRYIAAADLLAGHRAYGAAQILLRHLLDRRITGVARRALEGAVARSPNAALVDGLLRTCEHAEDHTADAVATAADVLGLRRERAAIDALLRLSGASANPIARKAAITALGRIGDRRVVDALVPALDDAQLAEASALSLLMLGDRRGIEFHARAMNDGRSRLTGSPGELVGRYGGPTQLPLLQAVANGPSEGALGALHGLGLLGDPRALPALIKALDPRDRRRTEVANAALRVLTGHTVSLEESGAVRRWRTWYEEHAASMPPGVRHREGRRFDMALLVEHMAHPDAWVRRTAYDELVITTGHALPFDVEGPWRVQQRHLANWRGWAAREGVRLQAGGWFFDGKKIS